jgi:hypothetical protein
MISQEWERNLDQLAEAQVGMGKRNYAGRNCDQSQEDGGLLSLKQAYSGVACGTGLE